eukprot:TRINITY_DN33724_c0_g1_i1.p1 TRINITY_DN33724_c0_g1~~TRINITY_DN33724_c0_g1_i1.p1  ORF type:complete len:725 (-),score=106.59 TRINITY_DN33724_c0_g1_i1:148-2247(-)
MWRCLGVACAALVVTSAVKTATEVTSTRVRSTGKLYVSPTGDDSNAGTAAKPFKTVQACANAIKASAAGAGTCVLETGRYTEAVELRNFGEITLEAAPGASPVIDGSKELQLMWNQHPSHQCVWGATVPTGSTVPWFLWAEKDGMLKPLTPARWPNAKFSDFSVFNNPQAESGGALSYSSASFTPAVSDGASLLEEASNGVGYPKYDIDMELTDDPNTGPSLKNAGIDFTDTYVVQSLGTLAQYTMAGRVSSFDNDTGSVTYQLPSSWKSKVSENQLEGGRSSLPYFFEGHPKLLDAEEEWSYNSSSGELLVYDCTSSPNNYKIRGRVRDISLTIRYTDHVRLDGIELFGTTFKHRGGGSLTFYHAKFSYPTFNKRTIGDESDVVLTELGFDSTSRLKLLGCRVLYADGAYFLANFKEGAMISNNVFMGSGYATSSSATLGHVNVNNNFVFDHNTVTYFNSMNGVAPGAPGTTIKDNYFAYQGSVMDGGVVHIQQPYQNGTVVTGNWIHDTMGKSIRCDRIKLSSAEWGEKASITRNVMWRSGGIFVTGDNHEVLNNVVIDVGGIMGAQAQPALGIVTHEYPEKDTWSKDGENANTKVENNAVDNILKNAQDLLPPLAKNNLEGSQQIGADWWKTEFVDFDRLDFRPKDGSALVQDSENYIGAYPKNCPLLTYKNLIPGSTLLSPLDHHAVPPPQTIPS